MARVTGKVVRRTETEYTRSVDVAVITRPGPGAAWHRVTFNVGLDEQSELPELGASLQVEMKEAP